MVDLNKVSKAVQNFVDSVKESGGNRAKIDTQKEYQKLSEYLAGGDLSKYEKEYVEGFKIEYEQAKTEEAVTKNAKKTAKNIAKMFNDKKSVDNDVEAKMLFELLKNTDGQFNKSDLEFFKNLLITNGYDSLLKDANRMDEVETAVSNLEKRADAAEEQLDIVAENVTAQGEKIENLTVGQKELESRMDANEKADKKQNAAISKARGEAKKATEVNEKQAKEIENNTKVNEEQETKIKQEKELQRLDDEIQEILKSFGEASQDRVEAKIAEIRDSVIVNHKTKVDLLKKLKKLVIQQKNTWNKKITNEELETIQVQTTRISL